jgi:hypothetical protein
MISCVGVDSRYVHDGVAPGQVGRVWLSTLLPVVGHPPVCRIPMVTVTQGSLKIAHGTIGPAPWATIRVKADGDPLFAHSWNWYEPVGVAVR